MLSTFSEVLAKLPAMHAHRSDIHPVSRANSVQNPTLLPGFRGSLGRSVSSALSLVRERSSALAPMRARSLLSDTLPSRSAATGRDAPSSQRYTVLQASSAALNLSC